MMGNFKREKVSVTFKADRRSQRERQPKAAEDEQVH